VNLVAIDFETANPSRVSICAAGLSVFVDGERTESLYRLVRPPKKHGWFHEDYIEVHGLTHLDVLHVPEFPAIMPEFRERLSRADLVVAHHAAFDIAHLHATLDYFRLDCPPFNYLCTCRLARRVWPELPDHKLSTVAAHVGLEFNHHHAQSDAETAGHVLLAMMKQVNAATPEELFYATGMAAKRF
jgi:DNA polymerase-3 subunit epsilon